MILTSPLNSLPVSIFYPLVNLGWGLFANFTGKSWNTQIYLPHSLFRLTVQLTRSKCLSTPARDSMAASLLTQVAIQRSPLGPTLAVSLSKHHNSSALQLLSTLSKSLLSMTKCGNHTALLSRLLSRIRNHFQTFNWTHQCSLTLLTVILMTLQ